MKEPRPSLRTRLSQLAPGPHAWRGAALGLLAATSTTWLGLWLSLVNSIFALVVTLLVATLLLVAAMLLGNLVDDLLTLFKKLPRLYRWLLVATVFLLTLLLNRPLGLWPNTLGFIATVTVAASLLGAALSVLASNFRTLTAPKRAVTLLGLALGAGGTVAVMVWLLWSGPSYTLSDLTVTVSPSDGLADPSLPGHYPVLTLTYGSGTDRRAVYGSEADLVTESVDIAGLVGGWSGPVGWLRSRFWGFNLSRAPLNARVWYPDGEGPFPLVLIVHGNHVMDKPSEAGYGYLAELLASRGFIVASIDQNFLNGGGIVEGILGGLREENDARAVLLLLHLQQWHRWNLEAENPFFGKVDAQNLALIGHSRGGEAAAIAAAFNRLPMNPDAASVRFDYRYAIRTVIAIAPSDGQYRPRRQGTPLEDVNYLVLQGAADGDVRSFQGSAQYDRVRFSGDTGFKAAVYLHGANHGQFNTVWGRADGIPWLLNRGEIMPKEAQEQLAKVFIGAFLEATLRGQNEYLALFRQPSTWLPHVPVLAQFADASTQFVVTYEEDLDLTTTTLPGGYIQGENLSTWREGVIALGQGSRETVAAYLGWRASSDGTPRYTVTLPDLPLAATHSLVLSLADGRSQPAKERLELTLQLRDGRGEVASVPLKLPPPFRYRALKPPLSVAFEVEAVLISYDLPLSAFTTSNPAFDPNELRTVSLVFDRTPQGTLILSELGFRLQEVLESQ